MIKFEKYIDGEINKVALIHKVSFLSFVSAKLEISNIISVELCFTSKTLQIISKDEDVCVTTLLWSNLGDACESIQEIINSKF